MIRLCRGPAPKFSGWEGSREKSGVLAEDTLDGIDGLRSGPSGLEDGGYLRCDRGAVLEQSVQGDRCWVVGPSVA